MPVGQLSEPAEFLKLMKFPREWQDWDMYPRDLFEMQKDGFQPGHENSPEHDRHQAFQWWLKKEPSKDQLLKLVNLTQLDPDKHMAAYVRGKILLSENCDDEIRQLIGDDWIDDE